MRNNNLVQVPLVPGKPFRPPPLNSDSLSEVELICFKVYKEKISMKDVHINRFLDGKCQEIHKIYEFQLELRAWNFLSRLV